MMCFYFFLRDLTATCCKAKALTKLTLYLVNELVYTLKVYIIGIYNRLINN